MKFKTQENETPKHSPFLDDIIDLIKLNKAFNYAIFTQNAKLKNELELLEFKNVLNVHYKTFLKLTLSLNSDHTYPDFTLEEKSVNSIEELVALEEDYYSKLVEVGNKALEANDIEVVACISKCINLFEHYFCTLNESNNKGETSS